MDKKRKDKMEFDENIIRTDKTLFSK